MNHIYPKPVSVRRRWLPSFLSAAGGCLSQHQREQEALVGQIWSKEKLPACEMVISLEHMEVPCHRLHEPPYRQRWRPDLKAAGCAGGPDPDKGEAVGAQDGHWCGEQGGSSPRETWSPSRGQPWLHVCSMRWPMYLLKEGLVHQSLSSHDTRWSVFLSFSCRLLVSERDFFLILLVLPGPLC
jgi:hypothetical protein